MEQCESSQLSTSHLSESDPVLPMELFSKIIDILGTRPAGSPLPRNQSAVLRTCALVCRSFAQLARDQLFHHITIGLHFTAKDRFMRFSQALKENDTLSAGVQELVIWLDSFAGGMISEEHFDQHKDVLSGLPRLKSLTVLFNSRFTSPPALYISSFCYHLINHYSTQQMLRSLHVKTMDELPYHSIFKSPAMREIRLDRCLELEEWEVPVPGLQKLALRKMDLEPWYIAYFPNLTALELLRTNFFEQEDKSNSPLSLPRFSVTHLTLESSSYHGGKFLPFISFVRCQATKHGFRPFEDIHYLKVILSHQIPDLETLLQDTVRLAHFTLQVDGELQCRCYRLTAS
ncbi:hypothetical protein BJ165DRAFT_281206 [Panaeolus papilionaceus]|nr:hypothetical protein BJ165DRAFT_281206 [Panaeolus papilionaceus]